MKTHSLEDSVLVTPALQQRLQDEADLETDKVNSRWWAGIVRSNGEFKEFSFGYEADIAEKLLAEQVVKTLNSEIDHGGAWVVQWTNGGARFVMLWMDADGDVQFAVDAQECVVGMVEAPLATWIGQADKAWELWKTIMRDALTPKPEQLFKKSMGQAPISVLSPQRADEMAGRDRTDPMKPIIL